MGVSGLGDDLGDGLGDDLGDILGGGITPLTLLSDCRLWYDAAVFTGSPVEAADNLGLAGPSADVAQTTESSRPEPGTGSNGLPLWTFVNASAQFLKVTGSSPNILDAGDEYAQWVVAQYDAVAGRALSEIGTGTVNEGISLFHEGASMKAFTLTGGGSPVVATAFSDTASVHVFRISLDSSNLTLAIDGVEASTATSGGVLNNITSVYLGSLVDGSLYPLDGDIYEVVLARNPTTAEIAAVDAHYAGIYL